LNGSHNLNSAHDPTMDLIVHCLSRNGGVPAPSALATAVVDFGWFTALGATTANALKGSIAGSSLSITFRTASGFERGPFYSSLRQRSVITP
jgi:hypothetical protein